MEKVTVYQFDVKGQTLTLDFGMYCWDLFCERMHASPSRISEVFSGSQTFKAMRCLIVCGVEANAYLRDLPNSATEADVTKIINDSPEIMGKMVRVAFETFIALNQKIAGFGDKTTLTEIKTEV